MSCTCKYGAGSAGVCGFCKHRAATNERLKKLEDAKASADYARGVANERAEKAESEVEREKTEHAEALTRLDAWRMRAGTAEAERDALRAQVEAARRVLEHRSETLARDVLNAMDEAKP